MPSAPRRKPSGGSGESARAETESALAGDLVRFLLRHPRLNKEAATNAFVETKLSGAEGSLPDATKRS